MSKYLTDFERSASLLVQMFCKKQDVDFDTIYIVGDRITETYVISDAYLSIQDIYDDLKTDQPKGFIFTWYWDVLDNGICEGKNWINYRSYCSGARYTE